VTVGIRTIDVLVAFANSNYKKYFCEIADLLFHTAINGTHSKEGKKE